MVQQHAGLCAARPEPGCGAVSGLGARRSRVPWRFAGVVLCVRATHACVVPLSDTRGALYAVVGLLLLLPGTFGASALMWPTTSPLEWLARRGTGACPTTTTAAIPAATTRATCPASVCRCLLQCGTFSHLGACLSNSAHYHIAVSVIVAANVLLQVQRSCQ